MLYCWQYTVYSIQGQMELQNFDNATLAERVYKRLRDDVLSNKYPPGEPLPEEAIATTLNVSRAPVREALRKLAVDGLVTIIRRHGAMVSSLSSQEYLEAYQIRASLEVLSVQLSFARLGSADLGELERLNQVMAQQANDGYIDKFFSTDATFHSLFINRSGNERLKKVYSPLIIQMSRYYIPSFYLKGGVERAIDEHQEIIRALRAKDVEKAVQLLQDHNQAPQRVLESGKQIELIPFAHSPQK